MFTKKYIVPLRKDAGVVVLTFTYDAYNLFFKFKEFAEIF